MHRGRGSSGRFSGPQVLSVWMLLALTLASVVQVVPVVRVAPASVVPVAGNG